MIKKSLILVLVVLIVAVLVAGCGSSSSTTSSAPSTTAGAASTTTAGASTTVAGVTSTTAAGGYTTPGAGSTSTSAGSTATSAAAGAASVMTSTNSQLGTFLVDGKGMTLYHFSIDSKDTSKCTDACPVNWPPFSAANLTVSSDLSASDFAQFTRPDGSMQTEYKGQPLYYFIKDTAPGQTNGQGINAFGGLWTVVTK